MGAKPSNCCATCGECIGELDVFIRGSQILGSVGWQIKCPSCNALNYIHPVASVLLGTVAFLLAAMIGLLVTRGGEQWWLLLIVFLLVNQLLRGTFVSLWLRVGQFRRSSV